MVMVGRPRLRVPTAVTASGTKVTVERGRIEVPTREWQKRNWQYVRDIGEVRYAFSFLSHAITKARFLVARRARSGDTPEPIEEGPAVELLDRIDSMSMGLPALIGEWAIHYQAVGETHLMAQDLDSDDEWWRLVSTEEIRKLAQGTAVGGGSDMKPITDADLLWRLWRPDPEQHHLPDAPLSSVADLCEDLILLTAQIRASSMSRLSAGILKVPTELTIVPMRDPEDEQDFDPRVDPFMEELTQTITTAIRNPNSASRVVPIVVRGPSDVLESMTFEPLERTIDAQAAEERQELIHRIATGLDMPATVVTGRESMNHWTAWLEDEALYKQHVDPNLLEILTAFSKHVFQPMLADMGVADAQDIILWRDLSDLVNHPDRFKDAILLYDRNELSGEALRRIAGINEEDAPAPTDVEAEPVDDEEPAADEPAQVEAGPPAEEGNPAAASARRLLAYRRQGYVASVGTDLGRTLAALDSGLVGRTLQAVDDAVERSIERAGAKARTKTRNFDRMAALIDGIPNGEVTRTLGRDNLARLGLEEGDLITDAAFQTLVAKVRDDFRAVRQQVTDEVEGFAGEPIVHQGTPDEDADAGAGLLLTAALSWATAELLGAARQDIEDGRAVLDGERARHKFPAERVWAAMSVAGGGEDLQATLADDELLRGIGNGEWAQQALREEGFITGGYQWVYGDPGARRTANFDPHRGLDGLQFRSFTDAALASSVSWIPGYFHPGDHSGCLCTFEREIIAEVPL